MILNENMGVKNRVIMPVVKVVVLIGLEVIFPSAVRSRRRYEEVDAVPHEGKGCGEDEEGRADAAVVVEVLDGMHAQTRERFNVCVAVVEGVDVLVESLDVDEPVGKVEMELAVKGNPEGCQNKHCRVPAAREGLHRNETEVPPTFIHLSVKNLLVSEVREAVGGIAMEEDCLPHGVLDDAHRGVEHVVDHLGQLVSPIGEERALRPAQQVEDTVPKTKEPKCDSKVYSKPS